MRSVVGLLGIVHMRLYDKIVNRPAGVGSDKYLHFLACQAIAFLTAKLGRCLMPDGWALLVGIVVAATAGVVKELRDRRTPGDTFSWSDVIADLAGAVAGAVMSL